MVTLLILLAILVVLALWAVGIFNGLVTARNAFRNAFAQIDVQLQRRFDLIPNLVETAKGYMKHERETLEAVIAARSAAMSGLSAAKANPGDPAAMAELANSQGVLERRARPADGRRRGLSGSQGEPEHDAALRRADLHREQGRLRAPGLQRLGDGLQQPARSLPVERGRRHVPVRAGGVARDPATDQAQVREAPKVQF